MASGLLLGGAVAALVTAAVPAHNPSGGFVDPPPDKIVINVATVNGSGCPAGTAAVAVSEDNTAFTVTYSDYLAQVGGDSDPTAFRKNCQLNLIVHVPQGFTYAIAEADYRGFASLQAGASGVQRASYYFQGSSQTAAKTHTFTGALQRQLAGDRHHRLGPTGLGALRSPAQLQHQHRAPGERGHLLAVQGQLHDDGLDRRRHQHHVPHGVEGVPGQVNGRRPPLLWAAGDA